MRVSVFTFSGVVVSDGVGLGFRGRRSLLGVAGKARGADPPRLDNYMTNSNIL